MKRFALLIIVSAFLVNACKNCGHCSPSPKGKTIENPTNVFEKYIVLREFAQELSNDNLIAVHPETFAKFMLCVFYAESGLETSAQWQDDFNSQGLNQLTANTRKNLGIPENILQDNFRTQLSYFKKFLVASGKGKLIKNASDLHCLNFAPSRLGREIICTAKNNRKYLDNDNDGFVTRKDMAVFIAKRCSTNVFVAKVFATI